MQIIRNCGLKNYDLMDLFSQCHLELWDLAINYIIITLFHVRDTFYLTRFF